LVRRLCNAIRRAFPAGAEDVRPPIGIFVAINGKNVDSVGKAMAQATAV